METVNSEFYAKRVVLATGKNRIIPDIKGIKKFEGKGISYCAICDAFFFKNKNVVVLGSGNYAVNEAKQIMNVTKSVKILTNGEKLVENRDISLESNEKRIKEVRGINKIEEVEFYDNTKMKIDGMFIAIGTASSTDLARKIGAVIENNNIKVNDNMQTSVNGLYACGDCIGGIMQISKAIYDGTKVGLEIIKNNKL